MVKLIWGNAKQLSFADKKEYYYALGNLCKPNAYRITFESNTQTESWADAYRIKCIIDDSKMPKAFIKAMKNARRINCNDYVENLISEHGFLFDRKNKLIYGSYKDVRKTVPSTFLDDFDAGYKGIGYSSGSASSAKVSTTKPSVTSKPIAKVKVPIKKPSIIDYDILTSEEISEKEAEQLVEGQKTTITINAFERNPEARKKCLNYYYKKNGGIIKCEICGFDFSKIYGKEFEGKIHIHHIREISSIEKEYVVDPEKDLLPVCPNCHMVIHSKKPAFTVEAVEEMIKSHKKFDDDK